MQWSSENDREDAAHNIELEFPEEISVSFVVLKWERRNVAGQLLTTEEYAYSKQEFAQFIKTAETYGVWAFYGAKPKNGRVGFA